MPLILILSIASFVSALSSRLIDPLVPLMARDLGVPVATTALLSSAYTFPYALSQPIIGVIGDQFGKERVLKVCIGMLMLLLAAAVVAPDYATLFTTRVLAGIFGGGIIPVAFAVIGDYVAMERRQQALARLVMASQTAVVLGSPLSGLVATQFGWRTIFALAAVAASVCFVLMVSALPVPPQRATTPLSLAKVRHQYATVLAHPMAKAVLAAAICEGLSIFGFMPYIADGLETRGLGGTWEAGLVIASMSVGGIAYTLLVTPLLRLFGRVGLIRTGGLLSAAALIGIAYSVSWPMEAAFFSVLGFGFYSIHNSLQTQATELAPTARSTALSLFAFCFFLGQAAGPVLYQAGFAALGAHVPVVLGGLVLLAVAFGFAFRLRQTTALA